MPYFSKYAEQKFEILNRHKVYITREQVEDAVLKPEKEKIKGKYLFLEKDGVGVVCRKDEARMRVLTFYPTERSGI